MLPALEGRPIRVEVRPDLGSHHAATSMPRRLILLDAGVLQHPGEFERVLIHELFHFAWLRLSNEMRRAWERHLEREFASRTPGELGWSAESRKARITVRDRKARSGRWRSYSCESFCDTAAWLFSGARRHEEFTLPARARAGRRAWFRSWIASAHKRVKV